jgi:hypothetical protein
MLSHLFQLQELGGEAEEMHMLHCMLLQQRLSTQALADTQAKSQCNPHAQEEEEVKAQEEHECMQIDNNLYNTRGRFHGIQRTIVGVSERENATHTHTPNCSCVVKAHPSPPGVGLPIFHSAVCWHLRGLCASGEWGLCVLRVAYL